MNPQTNSESKPLLGSASGRFRRFTTNLEQTVKSFSSFEKALFYGLGLVLILSALGLTYSANESLKVSIPTYGGSLTEGIIGIPHFANPLFAVSDAEKDLSSLIYSGLMKVGKDGTLIPDLAESYTISADQRTYTFKIKDRASFHDGELLTAQDVAFTITTALDPALKSPRRAQWEGVTIDVMGPKEVRFTLPSPYPAFLENTTLGIIPQHIWKSLPAEQIALGGAIAPIGSGPYKVESIDSKKAGVPVHYNLISFSRYVLGMPYIPKLGLSFFATEEDAINAFKKGTITSLANITPAGRSALLGKVADLEGDERQNPPSSVDPSATNPGQAAESVNNTASSSDVTANTTGTTSIPSATNAAPDTTNTIQSAEIPGSKDTTQGFVIDDTATLPRIFAVFFNQNNSTLLRDKDVRTALELATDHNAIINQVLMGAGTPIDHPLLPHFMPGNTTNELATTSRFTITTKETTTTKGKTTTKNITSTIIIPRTEYGTASTTAFAAAQLERAGWHINIDGVREKKISSKETQKLAFSLTTVNSPDLIATANILKDQWERLGAKIKIEIYESGDFNQAVLRPRKYDAVLFGQIIGRDADLYPFWHSSQRNDPGLNIAMYTNSKVDKALEESRNATSTEARANALLTALKEIDQDTPAIFLYAPHFVYVLPSGLNGVVTETITRPSERFASVRDWYLVTEDVWDLTFLTNRKR